MPIESKEILDYLGLESVEKLEDFREKFDPVFVRKAAIKDDKELHASLIGKVLGSSRTTIVNKLKEDGIEFEPGEIAEMKESKIPVEQIFEKGITKLKNHYQAQLDAVKANVGKPSEELEKAWQEKIHKAESKAKDYEARWETAKKEFEAKEVEFNGKLKGTILDTRKADLERDFKWSSDADELKKEGFKSVMAKKYKLDLDESGTLEIFNSKGERIPNPKKNGTFKTPLEVFEEEGLAAKVWAANLVADKAKPRPIMQHIESPAFPQNGRGRAIHPAAAAAEGRG